MIRGTSKERMLCNEGLDLSRDLSDYLALGSVSKIVGVISIPAYHT
jgi:hypothetical protein